MTLSTATFSTHDAIGDDTTDFSSTTVGYLLVRLDSAQGNYSGDLKKLRICLEGCRMFEKLNHLVMLDNRVVHDQILECLA